MKHDNQRYGTFSSSQGHKLMSNGRAKDTLGAPCLKYIKQVGMEQRLGRSINKEHNAKPTSYGTFLENRVFDLLPLEYKLVSQERLFHPTIDNWSGAPDLIKGEDTLGDCKCPYSLETFCDKIDALQNIDVYKEEFPEDYWQHISNSALLIANGYPITHFEAVIYCPYLSEWEAIKESLNSYSGDLNSIAWLNWATPDELPYLIEGGEYKNLNVFRFELNMTDVILFTERILMANRLLPK